MAALFVVPNQATFVDELVMAKIAHVKLSSLDICWILGSLFVGRSFFLVEGLDNGRRCGCVLSRKAIILLVDI